MSEDLPLGKPLLRLLMKLQQTTPGQEIARHTLLLAWRDVGGTFLSQHARPLWLRQGKLRVEVDSEALQGQIASLEHDIIRRFHRLTSLTLESIETVVVESVPPLTTQQPQSPPPLPPPMTLPEEFPPVREELRPILEQLWSLHRKHRPRK